MGEALNLAIMLTLKDAASGALSSIKEKLGGVGTVAAGLAGAAVGGAIALGKALWDAGKAAAEEEVGVARLGAAVTASGADWGNAQTAIEAYLASEANRVALDDGVGRDALTRLTTATGDYKQAMDLLPLAIDLAAAKQIPLATAAELVGKVAEGNTGVLGRYGIVLGEGATATEALTAMQQKFGGQGEAFAGTFEGQQQRMGIAMGNLKETIGTLVLPIMTRLAEGAADLATRALPYIEAGITKVQPFFTWLGGFVQGTVDVLVNLAQQAIPWVQGALAAVQPFFENVWAVIQTGIGWLQNLVGSLGGAEDSLGGVGAIVDRLGTLWDVIWSRMQVVFAPIIADMTRLLKNISADAQTFFLDKFAFIKDWFQDNMPLIQEVVATVMGGIRAALTAIGAFWESHGQAVMGIVSQVWQNIKATIGMAINVVLGVIKAVMQAITGDWSGAWNTIKGVLTGIWDTMKRILTETLNAVLRLFGTSLSEVLDSVVAFGSRVLAAIKAPFQTAYDWLVGLWNDIKNFILHIFDGVHIPTPHFSLTTEDRNILGINVPVPKINIDWYGAGLDAVFRGPTIIGVGESGAERVTVTPLRGGGSGGGGSGATYNLTYVDQRNGGGAPDLLGIARRLEWQARMGL